MGTSHESTENQEPVFSHTEPVLAVADVTATIKYWQEVLAFPSSWTWGEPPNHGGVSWHSAFLQFSLNPERAKASVGNVVWIRLKYIDQLYKLHQERNAQIDEPLTSRPWGLDEYVVKDLNGYYIVFSGHSSERKKSTTMPARISLERRAPTVQEFISLATSVGWLDYVNKDHLAQRVTSAAFSVVAIDTQENETIGSAQVLSDSASFYYIKDVMVRPDWQGKHVGTALMQSVSAWLDENVVDKSLIGLYTRENLEPFYQQFGFIKEFGMVKRIKR